MNRFAIILASSAAIALTGCETVQQTYTEAISATYTAELRGANEVGPGDPDGYGEAEISFADELSRVCWDLNGLSGLGPITGAHIHRGASGQDGPVVLPFTRSAEGGWRGCSTDTEWVAQAFREGLSNYYVNVHTVEYKNGAIRGQLSQ